MRIIIVVLIVFSTPALAAQEPPAGQEIRKQATAVRVANERVRVDGRLDEPAWTTAPPIPISGRSKPIPPR